MNSSSPATPPSRGVFVVGMLRSGTKLLHSLLAGHPELYALPRELMIDHWCGAEDPAERIFARSDLGDVFPAETPERAAFQRALRARLPGPAPVPAAIRATVEALAEAQPPEAGARAWVENTPGNLMYTRELLDAFGPETRFVCLQRDPRSGMAARKRVWRRRRPFRVAHYARRWATADELMHRYVAEHASFLIVTYEDVVLHTRETMERVAAHIGIPWHDNLLVPQRDGKVWKELESHGDEPGSISTASLDRCLAEMKPGQIREVEQLCGPRMRKRGYEPTSRGSLRDSGLRMIIEVSVKRAVRQKLA